MWVQTTVNKLAFRPCCCQYYSSSWTSLSSLSLRGSSSRRRSVFSRAYPDYRVYGEECALTIQPWMPTFREAGQSGGVAMSQAGHMKLGLTVRDGATGRYQWNDTVNFRITVEEIGLILNQVPNLYPVEISRNGYDPNYNTNNNTTDRYRGVTAGIPDKVLTITPQAAGSTVVVKADMVLDGIGGQADTGGNNNNNVTFPLTVTLQAGEFEVIKELLRSSISYLTGWKTMMDIATVDAMNRCQETSKITGTTTGYNNNNNSKFSGHGSDGPFHF